MYHIDSSGFFKLKTSTLAHLFNKPFSEVPDIPLQLRVVFSQSECVVPF